MGIVQSSVTPELAIAGALVAGSAAYGVYTRSTDHKRPDNESSNAFGDKNGLERPQESKSSITAASEDKKKGKGKKKGGSKASGAGASDAEFEKVIAEAKKKNETAIAIEESKIRVTSLPDVVPGAFDQQGAVSSEAEGSGKKARKKKAKKTPTTSTLAASSSTVVDPPSVVSGPVETSEPVEAPRPTKKEKKKKSTKPTATQPASVTQANSNIKPGASSSVKTSQAAASAASSQMLGMSVTLSDAPEDESWTRVSTRKKGGPSVKPAPSTEGELLTSDTNITTSVTDQDNDNTEDEGSVQDLENNKTFAERMLPRPRKTGVEDMEDEPLQPTLSRVMRVKPAPGQKPAKGFSWGDYEEYNQGEDGTSADGDSDDAWEEVKSKKKKQDRSTLASSVDSLGKSAHKSTASETLTKRQRQNANRYELIKAEKDAQEKDRQDRLAKHKRELERSHIAEQYASSGKKNLSGGMQAVVEDGKLLWE